ncbi:MAG TPA: sulfotransferase [Steroidobacter sp.]|nr:sulfotransferase [Steroidobacter sp.]
MSMAQEQLLRYSAAPTSQPQILYIMGTGRSGTTILEILLANNPGVTGVGELKNIFRDGFLGNRACACGKKGTECAVWSRVLQSTGWNRNDCVRLGQVVATLESHRRFPLLFAGLASRRSWTLYREANEGLFGAIVRVTQCRVIVDSSKYAGRALALARLFPGRVRVLCITRSAAGLLAAFGKQTEEQRPKGMLGAAAYYVYALFCIRCVRSLLKQRCFTVRFEDLHRDPDATLRAIELWSGYSLAASRARLSNDRRFDVGHIVSGNRLRKQGTVRFGLNSTETSPPGPAARLLGTTLEAYRRMLGF